MPRLLSTPRAEPHLRQALTLDTSLLGATHPTTLHVANAVAALLDASGKPAEAETLLRRIARWPGALSDLTPR